MPPKSKTVAPGQAVAEGSNKQEQLQKAMATARGLFPSHSTDALQKLLIEYDFDMSRVAEAVGSKYTKGKVPSTRVSAKFPPCV
eukprot:m.21751 g.21751  ORF g.21751 m.21751 type:complete len:84 (+) comp11156_c0_seq16:266-517(+)